MGLPCLYERDLLVYEVRVSSWLSGNVTITLKDGENCVSNICGVRQSTRYYIYTSLFAHQLCHVMNV